MKRLNVSPLVHAIVAESYRPVVAADMTQPGWVKLAPVTSGLTLGAPPLPIRREGVLVALVVEVEPRDGDWWGRVEPVTRHENGLHLASDGSVITPAKLRGGPQAWSPKPTAPEPPKNRATRRRELAQKRRSA